jgi:hypothetical protein
VSSQVSSHVSSWMSSEVSIQVSSSISPQGHVLYEAVLLRYRGTTHQSSPSIFSKMLTAKLFFAVMQSTQIPSNSLKVMYFARVSQCKQ